MGSIGSKMKPVIIKVVYYSYKCLPPLPLAVNITFQHIVVWDLKVCKLLIRKKYFNCKANMFRIYGRIRGIIFIMVSIYM